MEPVKSREYKMMLKADRFRGDESSLKSQIRSFYKDVQSVLGHAPLDIDVRVEEEIAIKKNRRVSFFDAPDGRLFLFNENGYVLRERIKIKRNGDLKDGDPQLTLKCRHRDRYFVQDRDMTQFAADPDEIKLEEDLKFELGKNDRGIMVTLYSFSSKQSAKIDLEKATVKNAIDLYPGLAKHLNPEKSEDKLVRVGSYAAHQRVATGAFFVLPEALDALEAECGIIVWYKYGASLKDPVVVEFSARYLGQYGEGFDPSVDKAFDGRVSKKVHDAFVATRHELDSWVDPESPTKTRFIFNQAHGEPA